AFNRARRPAIAPASQRERDHDCPSILGSPQRCHRTTFRPACLASDARRRPSVTTASDPEWIGIRLALDLLRRQHVNRFGALYPHVLVELAGQHRLELV